MRQCFQKFLARLSNRLRRSKSIGPRGERNHRRCPCTRAHLQEFSSLDEWHGSPIVPLVDRRRKLGNVTSDLVSVGASTAAAAPFGCCNQPHLAVVTRFYSPRPPAAMLPHRG